MKRLLLLLILFGFYQGFSQSIDDLIRDANYDQAITQINTALGNTSNPGTQLALKNKKAETLIRQGKFQEAVTLLNELTAVANKTAEQQAIVQSTSGLLYLNQGRNDQAIESLQQALLNFEKAGKSNSLEAAQTMTHLGNTYRTIGQFKQAEEQLMMALDVRQKQLPPTSEWIAATYNDLGLVYVLFDHDKALDYYEKALVIYEKIHGKDHPKVATARTNIGFAYQRAELYGDATNNFEAALATWEKIYPQPHPAKALTLYDLGLNYQYTNNYKAAHGYYERALAMYEQCYGKKHPDIARVRNFNGRLYLIEGKYADALNQLQGALQANVSDFNASDTEVNPRLKNFYDGGILLTSLLNKAKALETRHFNKTLKFSDLTMALTTLQKCDTLIDLLRQQITNESDKIALGAAENEVYADGVRMAYETGIEALKKKSYFEQAFYFAEKSKSAVLLEAISDSQAKSFAGIPADLLEEEKNLKAAIALCSQKLAQKPSADEEKYLRETSYSLNRSYQAFIKKLEGQFPEYFNLKFNTNAPTIDDLQKKLGASTALLSYFIDEKNSRLYIFQITHSKYNVVTHSLPKDFDRWITGMRNGIFYSELKAYRQSAASLSDLLLPKTLPRSVDDLILLPTGRLSIIPFEALFTDEVKETDTYSTLPYWIKQYAVRYEFSAGLILQKAEHQKKTANPSILLCAPVTFADATGLDDLPGTESEVKEIAQLFGSKNLTCGLYVKQKADEKLVKSGDLKNFSYLHFATHGVVDESNPELSRIFLQSDVGSEDGNLFAGEIYNLSLNAELVTLSACQTGLGKISRGEGVIGLSRALVYAGAESIVVSFWSVADESTSVLMKDFYQQMLDHPNQSFSQSLRLAKRNLIAKDSYSSPYFWAPFVLIGF